jgi:glycerol-3-phosphate O-acyltransferase
MNHRSNMDYVLAGFLAADQAALSYAVGEWARIWPLSALIRAMGAFFVRRDSRDELYRRVLERYIVMATEAGVPQAVFPEGSLTRDGRMREPKLGVLDYMLRGFRIGGDRDLVFVPLGLNYDRVLEDRTLLHEGKKPARATAALRTLSFVAHNLMLMLRSEWHRFGYACVSFGTPLSLASWCQARGVDPRALPREQRFARVEELAGALMERIGAVVPVVPVALVATVLREQPRRWFSPLELAAEAYALLHRLEAAGAHVYQPRQDFDYALEVGLRMLRLRRLVVQNEQGMLQLVPEEETTVAYYANSIAHLLPDGAQSAPYAAAASAV